MPEGQDIPPKATAGTNHHDSALSLGHSFTSPSPLAQDILRKDLEECSSDEDDDRVTREGPAFPPASAPVLTELERRRSRDAEISLLRDNHILPPRHPLEKEPGLFSSVYKRIFSTEVPVSAAPDEESRLAERQPLLTPVPEDEPTAEPLNEVWETAVAEGRIKTTWQRETQTITVSSCSLIVTFLLQYSISVASIFAVGRIGKLELGAVSLASMTANITCYALFQGLATSLDTLCAQAYGSGHRHLVGLQLQRMTYFLWAMIPFIAILWYNAESILAMLIPERRSAELAGIYLRIIIFGTPAMVLFEGGKRFVQAQGLFQATTYVLMIAAPINIFLNYAFVWRFGWGYVGAPIAVVCTQNLLPILLFLYVRYIDGMQCWGGFSKRAFTNWGPMVRLAVPGMIMVTAEWAAFEIITLATGQFGTAFLAAQSIMVTVSGMTFQIPFSLSIAGSTRVANLIGARLVDAAKTSAKVTFVGSLLIGVFNMVLLWAFRYKVSMFFTQDPEVIEIVASVMPVVAIMQVSDGLAAVAHGLLRSLGRQEIGGYVNLAVYYIVALPLSFGLGFGLDWKMEGLWGGVTVGLLVVSIVEYWVIIKADWDRSVREAEHRNATG